MICPPPTLTSQSDQMSQLSVCNKANEHIFLDVQMFDTFSCFEDLRMLDTMVLLMRERVLN